MRFLTRDPAPLFPTAPSPPGQDRPDDPLAMRPVERVARGAFQVVCNPDLEGAEVDSVAPAPRESLGSPDSSEPVSV